MGNQVSDVPQQKAASAGDVEALLARAGPDEWPVPVKTREPRPYAEGDESFQLS